MSAIYAGLEVFLIFHVISNLHTNLDNFSLNGWDLFFVNLISDFKHYNKLATATHTALYKGSSKLLVRLPHQFDRKKMSMGLSSFQLEFA